MAVPRGSQFKGYEPYQVQDLVLTARVVRYRRERWLTPDGETIVAPLPGGIRGHFGPELRRFVLSRVLSRLACVILLHGPGGELRHGARRGRRLRARCTGWAALQAGRRGGELATGAGGFTAHPDRISARHNGVR